jgi:type VI protein secretion system component Hcp
MNTQPENKDKAEQKASKDELSEKELEKATGGADGKVSVHDFPMTKIVDKSSPAL